MDPEALKTRPDAPWYVSSIVLHFEKLSFSRRYSQLGPLPVDIPSIFTYNDRIAKMDDEHFLTLIQALDAVYLKPKKKKEVM